MRDVITDHAYFEHCLKDEYNKGYMDGINCVLDKIRVEIEQVAEEESKYDKKWAQGLKYALKIIDKHRKNDTHVKTCMNCFHNYGVRHNVEFNPEDIVCEYWESDGLTKDDFCSRWKDKESEE